MPLFSKYPFFFFILFSILVHSQTKEEIQKLHSNFKDLHYTNFEKANQNARNAVTLSKQLADSTLILYSYQNLSKILYLQRNNKAILNETLTKAIELAKNLDKKVTLSNLYNLLGSLERKNNNDTLALKHYEEALSLAKKHRASKEILAINNNLARLYSGLEDEANAEKILITTIETAQKNNDLFILAEAYNILGTIEQDIDSALSFHKKALDLAKQINNKYLQGITTFNIGDVYLDAEKFEKSLPYLQESEKISTQVGDNANLHYINLSLGIYYQHIDNLEEAIKKYKKAIGVYGSFVDDYKKADALLGVSGIYEHLGKYEVANEYLYDHIDLKDSILNLRKKKAFEEIRTQYRVAEKDEKILTLAQEKVFLIVGTVLLLILILSLVLFYRHRIKVQKIIQKQKAQLFEKEKEALEREQEFKRIQGSIEGQEKEKNRISKELHDGIGGKLVGIRHLLQATDIPHSKTAPITNHLSSVTSEIRTLSHHLSSHYIINTPFENLLNDLQNQYKYSQAFTMDVNVFPEDCFDTLTDEIKHNLYRILQELLNNIVRHAQAHHIAISFVRHKNYYACTVEDDGVGFDIEKQQDGIGLINIKERIRNLHGTIEIHSSKNKGTTVAMEIPCER